MMTRSMKPVLFAALSATAFPALAQKANDVTAPLHALKVDYPVPYDPPSTATVKQVLDRIYHYLDGATPASFIHKGSGADLTDLKLADTTVIFKPGDFRLTSYEWGITYAGMLQVAAATGDKQYADYATKRMQLLADAYPIFKPMLQQYHNRGNPLRSVIEPHALDDAGAMCAAMIKSERTGQVKNLRPLIDNFIQYISTKEFRLPDGTLARNRPHPNTIWLDDLFMSVPALAQMGKLTGDRKYFDDAVKQVVQFSERMFNKQKNVYMHGWVQGMKDHPQFHWARANGWAILTKVELLDVLPENHPGRAKILELLRLHAQGLAGYQSGSGFWHQLLDRNDSYLETSATAIYAYCIARAIRKGWLDPVAYGPMALLAWNAVSTKVNDKGQVEGTCVGTGMGFEPAFYYYRPVNVYAAHGYGPVLLAGAAIYELLQDNKFRINDSALQYYEK
ncbi:glycoside hydrolase family 88/105 protein [Paraflavitalea pollutisoli]|uniref:glycoside hydrolase family 88/105 protein n=1 Tax=Paraflavitalea pollutisoli TaxID=3034143 RepID=UPI0023EB6D05|nr:glycoside hydrolase family 88 protein [Paraflavitalea sp. H1-2-19X]